MARHKEEFQDLTFPPPTAKNNAIEQKTPCYMDSQKNQIRLKI